MAVQFSKERFFIPALAPLLYNTGIIAGGLILGPWLGMEGICLGGLDWRFGRKSICAVFWRQESRA